MISELPAILRLKFPNLSNMDLYKGQRNPFSKIKAMKATCT